MKYEFIKLSCDLHLTRVVQSRLDSGWELHGPTTTVKEKNCVSYCQAMTLKERGKK